MIQKFDLHCHSIFSDGTSKISEIEDHCLKNNLAIALTDHNEIRGAVKLFENNKIRLIPAVEVITEEGVEILIYFKKLTQMEIFFRKQIEPFKGRCVISNLRNSFFRIIEHANELDTFISLPHPFGLLQNYALQKFKRRYPELSMYIFNKIDAIEVFNGHVSEKQAIKAQKILEKYKKKITVGSDAHELKYFGYTNISFEINNSSLDESFAALKKNQYMNIRFVENKRRHMAIFKFYSRNILNCLKNSFIYKR